MNDLSKAIAGIIAATAIVAAVPANAESKRKMSGYSKMPSFEELDANGDGSVSMEEAEAHIDSMIAASDTEGDGMISAEELKNAIMQHSAERMEMHGERMFKWLDENDDGMLSKEEFISAEQFSKMFERLDSDEDGAISKEEFDAMKSMRGKGRHGDRKGKRGYSKDGEGQGHDKDGNREHEKESDESK